MANNPKNDQSALYRGLTRLFSGPIATRRRQKITQYKSRQLDKFKYTSAITGQEFKKTDTGTESMFNKLDFNYLANLSRTERYNEFNQMEFDPIICSVLDLYGDEITTSTEFSPLLNIKCHNEEIKSVLTYLYYSILNIEFNLYWWARTLCKYGDFFLYIEVDDEIGVKYALGLPANAIERLEGLDSKNPNYVQFQWNAKNATLEDWQVAHFRILGNDKYAPYGMSVLDPARRIWRQLCLRGTTPVWCVDGFKYIKDLKSGDKVYSYDYKSGKTLLTPVKHSFCVGKDYTYKIKTAHKTLYATADHPILTSEGIYKKVSELSVDDYIVMPKIDIEEGQINFRDIFEKLDKTLFFSKSSFDINTLEENYLEFMRFLGFMLGYGWIDSGNNTVCFSIGSDSKLTQRYVKFVEKLGLNYSIRNSISNNDKTAQCNIDSKQLQLFLEKIGFNSGCHNKVVPSWVFACNNKAREEFLWGFIDADGCARKDGGWQYCIANKEMAEQFRVLIQQLGYIVGKITTYPAKEKIFKDKIYNCLETYSVSFRKKSMYTKEKQSGVFIERIFDIQKECIEDVYDIEVENELHNFIADGVVVSNCLLEDAMMAYRIVRAPDRRVFYLDVGNIPPENVEQYVLKAMSQMKHHQVIDSSTGRVDLRYTPFCHFPNDYVYLCDGSMQKIGELSKKWKDRKEDIYVWSLDENHNVVPTKLLWAGKTIEKTKFIEVELDDGQIIRTTPEHKWLLRDGTKVEAKNLKKDDSLMPFYAEPNRKLTQRHGEYNNFYVDIYHPGKNKRQVAHRIVSDNKYGKVNWPEIIHHIDHCKFNNNPNNLQKMTLNEYAKSARGRKKSSEILAAARKKYDFSEIQCELWRNPVIRKKRINKLSLKIDTGLIRYLFEAIEDLSTSAREYKIREYLNSNVYFREYLQDLNSNFKNGFNNQLTKMQLLKCIRKMNFNNLREVKDFYVSLKAPWNKVLEYCKIYNPNARAEVFKNFGITKYDFSRLLELNNISLAEFDQKYLNGGYCLDKSEKKCEKCNKIFIAKVRNKLFCSKDCYYGWMRGKSWNEIRNHKIKSVKISEFECEAYGLTVESSTHIIAIGGENAPKLRNKIWKSGVFMMNSIEHDYYIPVRGASNTKVESLPGGKYTGDIDDVKYLKDKLFSALKFPQSYLMRGEGAEEDKAGLAQKDIRFARTTQRIQRSLISELEKVGIIHLYTLGYREEDLISFSLSLNNPSKIAELQMLEEMRTRLDVAKSAAEIFSRRYIGKNIFNLSDEEIVKNSRELYTDKYFAASLATEGTEDLEGLGDVGGELGLETGETGLEGLEGLEAGGIDAEAPEEVPEEETALLAAPAAKRKKYWYTPVKDDKRDMGARKRSYQSQYSSETGKNTKRNVFKGKQSVKDVSNLNHLSALSHGIYENKDPNYDEEEIFNVSTDINKINALINNLEKLKKDEE